MEKNEILSLLEDEVLNDGQNYVKSIAQKPPVGVGPTPGMITYPDDLM